MADFAIYFVIELLKKNGNGKSNIQRRYGESRRSIDKKEREHKR